MDTSRKANREKDEITLRYTSQPEQRRLDESNDVRLAKLLTFMSSLERTPPGIDELQRRTKHFGVCRRGTEETSGEYYARLRHWLDRDIPQTKVPRHRPRQTSD